MTDTKPDLSSRVEDALLSVFREAFDKVPVFSNTSPGERSGTCIGIKVEEGAEEPIGTNMFDVSIEVEARNFSTDQAQLLADLIGNSHSAKETLSLYSSRHFVMPRGQAVEMLGAPRTVEDQGERIITYSLSASIQPL